MPYAYLRVTLFCHLFVLLINCLTRSRLSCCYVGVFRRGKCCGFSCRMGLKGSRMVRGCEAQMIGSSFTSTLTTKRRVRTIRENVGLPGGLVGQPVLRTGGRRLHHPLAHTTPDSHTYQPTLSTNEKTHALTSPPPPHPLSATHTLMRYGCHMISHFLEKKALDPPLPPSSLRLLEFLS